MRCLRCTADRPLVLCESDIDLLFHSSHIGQSRETDIGHLAELMKRNRLSLLSWPHYRLTISCIVLQTHPDGVSSLQFTNLLARLLEQVRRITLVLMADLRRGNSQF